MDYAIIGQQIAKARKGKGITQLALADLLYVTPQAVSKWERGESLPDIFMLAKISDIFDIYDLGYFLDRNQNPCVNYRNQINTEKGGRKVKDCKELKTIEDYVEFWQSCSLKGLQKIAIEHGVAFLETDTKEILVQKLTDGMNTYCEQHH